MTTDETSGYQTGDEGLQPRKRRQDPGQGFHQTVLIWPCFGREPDPTGSNKAHDRAPIPRLR